MTDNKPKDASTTVIGPDTKIKGEMSFSGTARILGGFEGIIDAKGDVEIGSTAKCKAAITAANVVLDGTVEGDVTGHEKVQLSAHAKLHGDLVATTLVIAEGAAFVGHCRVGPDAVKDNGKAAGAIESKPAAQPQAAARK
jgi:cytoskeletal protein CcmA (bactofilin family)